MVGSVPVISLTMAFKKEKISIRILWYKQKVVSRVSVFGVVLLPTGVDSFFLIFGRERFSSFLTAERADYRVVVCPVSLSDGSYLLVRSASFHSYNYTLSGISVNQIL